MLGASIPLEEGSRMTFTKIPSGHRARCVRLLFQFTMVAAPGLPAASGADGDEALPASGCVWLLDPCRPEHCLDPESTSIPMQFRLLAECMGGPRQYHGLACGCADLDVDHSVSLRDFAVFQNVPHYLCKRALAIQQAPWAGDCARCGTADNAIVVSATDGSTMLVGELVHPVQPNVTCPPEEYLRNHVRAPFPPRLLNESEMNHLLALLRAIPSCDSCNYAADPCSVMALTSIEGDHDDYSVWSSDPKCLDHYFAMRAVLDYVTTLATGQ
jgi:hypothetical protein